MFERVFLALVFAAVVPSPLAAQTATDATDVGPFSVINSEYRLPAAIDPIVLADAPADLPLRRIPTELWARVYRPDPMPASALPLLVFLHGNHATCGRLAGAGQGRFDINIQYTFTGTCPTGFVVVPNHEGYAYVAQRLASHGYLVVSINANRGVNAAPGYLADLGLNLRRGRLVLRHLEQLYKWHSGAEPTPPSVGPSLLGRIDFSHVGFLGHSRGGEGVRAAYNFHLDPSQPGVGATWQARIPGMVVQGIFEIGPVDGQTSLVLNAAGTVWNVLLPMCDGDVFNLQGVRPFDRMMLIAGESPPRQKSTYTVWGANHNFYNTEWQVSDSPGCFAHKRLFDHLLGSAEQLVTGLASVMAFFRGNVGPSADPIFNQNFNPEFALPPVVADVTRVDRGYTDSPSATVTTVFDDFPISPTNSYIANNVTFALSGIANHSSLQRVAQIAWNGAVATAFFQSTRATNLDASGASTLDFRIARQCGDPLCTKPDSGFNTETNFSIRLVDGNGDISSPEPLSNYVSLTGPVGGLVTFVGSSPHPILQTVRIPLSAFSGVDVSKLRGVRFVFDDTRRDEIFIGNIRLSTQTGNGLRVAPIVAELFSDDPPIDLGASNKDDVNQIKSMRLVQTQATVEIELASNREFVPQGELLVLVIGDQEFPVSQHTSNGDTNTVIFTLTAAEFERLSTDSRVSVQYGSGVRSNAWNFGRLDKNMLGR
jgi:hypothetical protein